MGSKSVIDKIVGFFANLEPSARKFSAIDFAVLKTMLRIAAIDGLISGEEIAQFRAAAEKCRGCNDASFAKLWEEAQRSAGYLLLLARSLDKDELVKAFVRESEPDFVENVVFETKEERERAFARLEEVAMSDGDYSDIERACITALVKRVKSAWDQMTTSRFARVSTLGA